MSKQVKCVNIEPEIWHGNWYFSIINYNFVIPFTSCKADTIMYNAGHTYTVQELVKEVTLKTHSNILCSYPMKR